MPRLHMQVLQPGTERKACTVSKYFCVVKVMQYLVYEGDIESLLKITSMKFEF